MINKLYTCVINFHLLPLNDPEHCCTPNTNVWSDNDDKSWHNVLGDKRRGEERERCTLSKEWMQQLLSNVSATETSALLRYLKLQYCVCVSLRYFSFTHTNFSNRHSNTLISTPELFVFLFSRICLQLQQQQQKNNNNNKFTGRILTWKRACYWTELWVPQRYQHTLSNCKRLFFLRTV